MASACTIQITARARRHCFSCPAGVATTVWNAQAPELAQTVRVITVDLPGHGQSDKPELAYTMDFYARSLDAVLRDAGVKFATLVGPSNGSPVVRQFYRRHPEKVRGLVIVDGALRLLGDAAMMEKFVASLRAPNYAETAGKLIDGLTGPMKDPGQHVVIKAMMLRTPQRVAVSELEGTLEPALWTPDKDRRSRAHDPGETARLDGGV